MRGLQAACITPVVGPIRSAGRDSPLPALRNSQRREQERHHVRELSFAKQELGSLASALWPSRGTREGTRLPMTARGTGSRSSRCYRRMRSGRERCAGGSASAGSPVWTRDSCGRRSSCPRQTSRRSSPRAAHPAGSCLRRAGCSIGRRRTVSPRDALEPGPDGTYPRGRAIRTGGRSTRARTGRCRPGRCGTGGAGHGSAWWSM